MTIQLLIHSYLKCKVNALEISMKRVFIVFEKGGRISSQKG